jgi:proline dehydrogenase
LPGSVKIAVAAATRLPGVRYGFATGILSVKKKMEHHLLETGSAALKKAALNAEAKAYLLENEKLFRLIKKAADRYIGGENLEEALQKAVSARAQGLKCSLEYMGENVGTAAEAAEATKEFVRICQGIATQALNGTVSLDLSHIGLNVSRALCLENLQSICNAAAAHGTEVIISAEGTEQTDHVLEVYKQAAATNAGLAITLQAYLHRSKDDFADLVKLPGRIRVVKGAFATSAGLSIPRGVELNDVYLNYIDVLLSSRHACSIATHDDEIQQQARKLVDLHKPAQNLYEFESLYGIQPERLLALKADGYMTKLYFVYGKEWYLYLCNRIAEYPLNLFQAVADIVG